ncbi:MAG: YkgJ family cysteine cluster protein [Verrucomicrobia bacterium]|nr:YkgJ family cysteine cluster protein [Verrucomicrobiota bacterium]
MTEPWYKDGLPFKCTGCGMCCTGSPGFVWVSEEEIVEMAKALDIPVLDFAKRYCRLVEGEISLKEDPENFDCVFLKDKKCLVYKARPKQCRTFPFWRENLRTKEDWEETAQRCEGINDDAPIIPLSSILKNLE